MSAARDPNRAALAIIGREARDLGAWYGNPGPAGDLRDCTPRAL